MDAFQDHGTPLAQPFGTSEVGEAAAQLERLAEAGVDLDDVGQVLEDQGVDKFAKSWHELLDDVERERAAAAS
jgi:transaldolase